MKIKLTKRLKAHAVKAFGLKATDSDATFERVLARKLLAGELSSGEYRKLTAAEKKPEKAGRRKSADNGPDGARALKDLDRRVADSVGRQLKKLGLGKVKRVSSEITPEQVLARSAEVRIRVKEAADSYSRTKKAAIYPTKSGRHGDGSPHLLAGQPARFGKVDLEHPSDLDKAVSQAYLKWCVKCSSGDRQLPVWLRLTDHDSELIQYALRHMAWSGLVNGRDADAGAGKVYRQKLSEFQVKALLDDSISGGIEAAPIAFDDAIVLIPVLYGELFPYVNVVNIARGRRVKGALMQNPSFTSGIAEGTAITPFNTASFVSAFDTTIFPAVAAMEIGLDFEEDSPVDLGTTIIENYGLKALEWLDRVIAVGDGVTEPTGIFTGTGTTAVLSDNGSGGPPTVSDYEGLMFGVAKQFRTEPGAMPVYMANDTSYRRARSIAVGPGDERRVFGMTHQDYMLLDRPYKVQNDIANSQAAFVNLKRYRMYRRLGLNVRVETAGRSLALNNTRLIVLRMRFGGQLETGGAAAVCTTMQT